MYNPLPLFTSPSPTDFGYMTLVAGFEHGIIHCIRFTVANEAWIIYETDTGRSGMAACLLLLPIVLPMKFDFFKKRVSGATQRVRRNVARNMGEQGAFQASIGWLSMVCRARSTACMAPFRGLFGLRKNRALPPGLNPCAPLPVY